MDRQTFFAWRREPFRQAAVGAARFIFPDIVGPIEPPGAYNDELPPALRSLRQDELEAPAERPLELRVMDISWLAASHDAGPIAESHVRISCLTDDSGHQIRPIERWHTRAQSARGRLNARRRFSALHYPEIQPLTTTT
jgi:hypothetical protein